MGEEGSRHLQSHLQNLSSAREIFDIVGSQEGENRIRSIKAKLDQLPQAVREIVCSPSNGVWNHETADLALSPDWESLKRQLHTFLLEYIQNVDLNLDEEVLTKWLEVADDIREDNQFWTLMKVFFESEAVNWVLFNTPNAERDFSEYAYFCGDYNPAEHLTDQEKTEMERSLTVRIRPGKNGHPKLATFCIDCQKEMKYSPSDKKRLREHVQNATHIRAKDTRIRREAEAAGQASDASIPAGSAQTTAHSLESSGQPLARSAASSGSAAQSAQSDGIAREEMVYIGIEAKYNEGMVSFPEARKALISVVESERRRLLCGLKQHDTDEKACHRILVSICNVTKEPSAHVISQLKKCVHRCASTFTSCSGPEEVGIYLAGADPKPWSPRSSPRKPAVWFFAKRGAHVPSTEGPELISTLQLSRTSEAFATEVLDYPEVSSYFNHDFEVKAWGYRQDPVGAPAEEQALWHAHVFLPGKVRDIELPREFIEQRLLQSLSEAHADPRTQPLNLPEINSQIVQQSQPESGLAGASLQVTDKMMRSLIQPVGCMSWHYFLGSVLAKCLNPVPFAVAKRLLLALRRHISQQQSASSPSVGDGLVEHGDALRFKAAHQALKQDGVKFPALRVCISPAGIDHRLLHGRAAMRRRTTLTSGNLVAVLSKIFGMAPDRVLQGRLVCRQFREALLNADSVVLHLDGLIASPASHLANKKGTACCHKLIAQFSGQIDLRVQSFRSPKDLDLAFPVLPNLTSLDITSSLLHGLRRKILGATTRLTRLQLRDCHLWDPALGLLEALPAAQGLTELGLGSNALSSKAVPLLGVALQKLTQLVSLDLEDNFLEDADLSIILESSAAAPMRSLNVSCNKLEAPQSLGNLPASLETLNLAWNKLRDKAAVHKQLLSHDHLTELDLRPGAGDDDITILRPPSKCMHTLTSLNGIPLRAGRWKLVNLKGRSLGGPEMLVLAEAFRKQCNAEHLDLSNNRIGPGDAHLRFAFRIAETIRTLDLSFNPLGAAGCKELANALSAGTALRRLRLNGAAVGAEGALHLSQLLAQLKEMSLSRNKIGNKGLINLGLSRATALRALNLSFNEIDSDGVAVLVREVRRAGCAGATNWHRLREVRLAGNRISLDDAVNLVRIWGGRDQGRDMRVLDLRDQINDPAMLDGIKVWELCCGSMRRTRVNRLAPVLQRFLPQFTEHMVESALFELSSGKDELDRDIFVQSGNLAKLSLAAQAVAIKKSLDSEAPNEEAPSEEAPSEEDRQLFEAPSRKRDRNGRLKWVEGNAFLRTLCWRGGLGQRVQDRDLLREAWPLELREGRFVLADWASELTDASAEAFGLAWILASRVPLSQLSLRGGEGTNTFLSATALESCLLALDKSAALHPQTVDDLALLADRLTGMLPESLWHLESFDLEGNEIGDLGLSRLCQVLHECTRLSRLKLAGNGIVGEELEPLAQVLQVCAGSLTELDLSRNRLSGMAAFGLQFVLAECSQLTALDLSWNQIDLLCWDASPCTTLRRLDLSGNQLGVDGITELAKWLPACTRLAHVGLSRCAVGSLGARPLCTSLEELKGLTSLDLAENRITSSKSLALLLQKTRTLQCLNLTGNALGGQGAIFRELSNCRCLTELALDQLPDVAHKQLTKALTELKTLARIHLCHGDVSVEGARRLGAGLAANPALVLLRLSSVLLGDDAMVHLSRALGKCRALTMLDLSGDGITEEGARILASVPEMGGCKALRHLDVSNNRMGKASFSCLVRAFAACHVQTDDVGFGGLGKHSRMEEAIAPGVEIDLSFASITSSGAATLADFVQREGRVKQLTLSGNREIHVEGASKLALALDSATSLVSLAMGSCSIPKAGTLCFAREVGKCARMQRLDLSRNELGDLGLEKLSQSLGTLAQLEQLDLSRGAFGMQGLKHLSIALADARALTDLNLSGNRINDAGARELGQGLCGCSALSRLRMRGNMIGGHGGALLCTSRALMLVDLCNNAIVDTGELAEALSLCNALTHLDLSRNDIGNEGVARLSDALSAWPALRLLDLSTNLIADSGLLMLARADGRSCVDLRGNHITGDGAAKLEEIFRHMLGPTLALRLESNMLPPAAQEWLQPLLADPTMGEVDTRVQR